MIDLARKGRITERLQTKPSGIGRSDLRRSNSLHRNNSSHAPSIDPIKRSPMTSLRQFLKSSRRAPPLSSLAAVLGPIPRIPLILSAGSPVKALKSHHCSGVTPYADISVDGPIR